MQVPTEAQVAALSAEGTSKGLGSNASRNVNPHPWGKLTSRGISELHEEYIRLRYTTMETVWYADSYDPVAANASMPEYLDAVLSGQLLDPMPRGYVSLGELASQADVPMDEAGVPDGVRTCDNWAFERYVSGADAPAVLAHLQARSTRDARDRQRVADIPKANKDAIAAARRKAKGMDN